MTPDTSALDKLGQALTRDDRLVLREHMTLQALDDGQVLIQQGDHIRGLWLVESGQLEVYLKPDKPVVLNTVGPADWLGEISLLDPGPATASVRARGATVLLYLSPEALERIQADHPRVARHVIRALGQTLAQRLRRSSARVLQLQGEDIVLAEAPKARGWFARVVRTLTGQEDA